MNVRALATLLLHVLVLVPACGPAEDLNVGGRTTSTWTGDLEFVNRVRPGDIVLTNVDSGRGCWYLNKLENWAMSPRYCHAALVTETDESSVTTIEALNPSQNLGIMKGRQDSWASYVQTKIAVVRVVDDEGQHLSSDEIQNVVDKALSWKDAKYVEPPISLHGDPMETGLYCSMLPYRAYLDATGIDLDGGNVPLIVMPDGLYQAKNARVIFESAPKDPPPSR